MKLIVGLGNVGDKYCFTRHNIGFMTVDKLALDYGAVFREEKKFKCYMTKIKLANEDVLLVKPTTFMNLSGDSVQLIMNYYKIPTEDLLVVYDDLSIDIGKMRFRGSGSDGGHNGIKSIIKCVNSSKIVRLKIGIGPQPPVPAEVFVLQNFSKEQLEELKVVLKKAVEGIEFYFSNGLQKAQNSFN